MRFRAGRAHEDAKESPLGAFCSVSPYQISGVRITIASHAMKPKIVIRTDRPHRDGRCPVQLQIYIDRKRVAITLKGLAIDPEHWDPEQERLRKSCPDYQDVQLEMGLALGRAHEILRDYRLQNLRITAHIFRREFKNVASRQDFLDYWKARVESEYKRRIIGPATRDSHLRTWRKLKDLYGSVLFSQVSREWLEGWDEWHAGQLEQAGHDGLREREKALKQISKYLRAVKQEGKKFEDPFINFSWPRYSVKPVFLEKKEILELLHFYRNPQEIEEAMVKDGRRRGMSWHHLEQYAQPQGVERIRSIARCFLWQCFTGMRYSDLEKVTHQHIEGDHLVWVPEKTRETSGVEVRMLITPVMREMIITSRGKLIQTISNQKYNLYLKELARLAGIKKNLTSHVGRHTYATTFLTEGGSIEVLQQLMGLRSLKTLMVYVHITAKRKDQEQQAAWSWCERKEKGG